MTTKQTSYILVSLLLLVCTNTEGKNDPKCGYEACNSGKEGMINVHIVPHTHDDVGWLKTVDQYYTSEVQWILDSVVQSLQENPERRFSYVETAFFYRWWRQQDDIMRHRVKALVNNGQLSFILGGWCMNDEAATHYNAIIDQHTRGVKFLKDNFGECGRPRVAWQIDPFGHSREQASLFAQMGYDAVYFARIDYQDYKKRNSSKQLEMIWKGSDDLKTDLFTGALYGLHYGSPPGMDFDIYADNYIQDDHRLKDYNVDAVVNLAIRDAKEQGNSYQGGHIMWTEGDDFNYQSANNYFKNLDKLIENVNARGNAYTGGHQMWTEGMDFNYQSANHWFKNLDKLIHHVNARQANGSKVNLLYSTPTCYTLAKNKAKVKWTSKSDDFFPYAHRAHAYWTGYFTSRAALKGMVRDTNNFLQAAKQLDALARLGPEHSSDFKLDVLKRAMGVAQHHDAVSGTAKQVVTYDYEERLADGVNACMDVVNHAYQALIKHTGDKSFTLPDQMICPLANISVCNTTEKHKSFSVLVYNPLGRPTSVWVKLPVSSPKLNVTDYAGKMTDFQVNPVSNRTMSIPERNGSIAKYELNFKVQIPPLGYSTYFVTPATGRKSLHMSQEHNPSKNADISISNKMMQLTFDGKTGLLKQIYNIRSMLKTNVNQQLMYYIGMQGNNSKPEFTASGAYLFRPNTTSPRPINKTATLTVVKGPLYTEIHQSFANWSTQVFRLREDLPIFEVEWTVGPIPYNDSVGREIISRITTDLNSQGVFYTDANGRQVLTRTKDYRETWKLNITEPVSGNYYPVNSRIYIQDLEQSAQLTILTDRSQGGSSILNGSIELMLHRVTMCDDALGVGEPLQETGSDGKGLIVRGRQIYIFETIARSGKIHRDLAERMFMAPIVTVAAVNGSTLQSWKKNLKLQNSFASQSLPENVHLLTLESLTKNTLLVRLEHFYAKLDDSKLSLPVTVSLKKIFNGLNVVNATELTLEANQKLSDSTRLSWNGEDFNIRPKPMGSDLNIELQPMMIRTFEVTIV